MRVKKHIGNARALQESSWPLAGQPRPGQPSQLPKQPIRPPQKNGQEGAKELPEF